ncbi:MAG TPA: addiction module protein [Urbifossiella sp.]|nr:addiction module protein [Urbifossiella sp.]
MPPDLRAAVLALPPDERLQLAEELWDSVTADDGPLTDAQFAELERRRANLEANPATGRRWEDVFARLKARSGG